MNEILVACGDMALLKQILSELPAKAFKPIATRNGAGTAQKVAHRNLVLAIVHADLTDGQAPAPSSAILLEPHKSKKGTRACL